MTAFSIEGAFGPPPGDRATLSKARLTTLDALFRHPLAHNLDWVDVVALFTTLGAVQQRPHNDMAFDIGGERHIVRKPHGKDLTTNEVIDLRHLLTRAGWHPGNTAPSISVQDDAAGAPELDLLVVVTHDEARIYHLDFASSGVADGVIRPHDPHHVPHRSSHKDHPVEPGQPAMDDPEMGQRIAAALATARRVVVVGHGEGHSNAAHRLLAWLKLHHPETSAKIRGSLVQDLSAVTLPQLLAIGRRALSE